MGPRPGLELNETLHVAEVVDHRQSHEGPREPAQRLPLHRRQLVVTVAQFREEPDSHGVSLAIVGERARQRFQGRLRGL